MKKIIYKDSMMGTSDHEKVLLYDLFINKYPKADKKKIQIDAIEDRTFIQYTGEV
jgi:hypothetical protein